MKNLYFWIQKNEANENNFYDDCYWTYNSVKAFEKLFPYVSSRKIANALSKLEDLGIIKTGNYNKSAYDRTKWYAFTKKGYSIMQKCKMEESEMSNGNDENVKPIPDNKPNKKSNSKTDTLIPYEQIKDLFNTICSSYPKIMKLTDARKRLIKARYEEYGEDISILETLFKKAEESNFLKGNNSNGWKANFDWLLNTNNMIKVLEDNYKNKQNPQTNPKPSNVDWEQWDKKYNKPITNEKIQTFDEEYQKLLEKGEIF